MKKLLWIGFWFATVAVAIFVIAWGWTHPSYLTWEFWQAGRNGVIQSSKSEVVRNLGLLALGGFGLIFGIWRAILAHRNQLSIEQGQITERFTKAVEQLGSPELAVRQGAIHALWRIAEDSPERDYPSVLDVLCSFVRNKEWPEETDSEGRTIPPQPDVITVLDRIRDRSDKLRKIEFRSHIRFSIQRDRKNGETAPQFWLGFILYKRNTKFPINLSRSYLCGAELQNTDLTGAKLSNAKLDFANLRNSKLTSADCSEVSAKSTDFRDSQLPLANFFNAEMDHVDFNGADLTASNFNRASLRNMAANKAQFKEATFWGADLTEARLSNANFSSTIFWEANLEGALFHETIFKDANLSDAHFGKSGPKTLEKYMIQDAWAYIGDPPHGLLENNFPMPRLVPGDFWDFNFDAGYPKDAPPNGMTDEEIETYWVEQETKKQNANEPPK